MIQQNRIIFRRKDLLLTPSDWQTTQDIWLSPYHFKLSLNTFSCIKNSFTRLVWWLSGKEFSCQCGGHGFYPWSGKIPYAARQLGPMHHSQVSPQAQNLRSATREATAMKNSCTTTKEQPQSLQLEKACAATKTQHSQNIKKQTNLLHQKSKNSKITLKIKTKPSKNPQEYRIQNVFQYCQTHYFIYLIVFLMSNYSLSCFNLWILPFVKRRKMRGKFKR